MRALLAPLLCCVLAAPAALADVVDLSGGGRRTSNRPPTIALKGYGGTEWAPFGRVGGALSYFSPSLGAEFEAGAGAGFPGVTLGIDLRKLFGQDGDYIVVELAVAGNTRRHTNSDNQQPNLFGGNVHAWSNFGGGFQHRAGTVLLGISGGVVFTGWSSTPSWYAQANVGVGLF